MNEENIWMFLPDTLLLQIFTLLSSTELLRAAQTCRAWLRMSRAEVLWKSLLYKEWKIDRSLRLPSGRTSFFREVRRLRCNVPCVEAQVLRVHTDQVLHVSFAHNGKLFATCSKDGSTKVWKVASPVSLKYHCDMKELLHWQYTQISQFNASDTLLLVSGVHFGPNSISGEIAVFNLKDKFALQARVKNKPFDIFGCWLNNTYLLSGNFHYLGHASSCSALWLNKATQEVLSEQESVIMRLFKFLNLNGSHVRSILIANCRNLGKGDDFARERSVNHRAYDSSCCKASSSRDPVLDSVSLVPDSSESELESRAGPANSYMYESDTEMTASESDVGQFGNGLDVGRGSNEEWDNGLTSSTASKSSSKIVLHPSSSDPCLSSNSVKHTLKTLAVKNSAQQLGKSSVASHVQFSEKDLEEAVLSVAQNQASRQSRAQEMVRPRNSPAKRDVSNMSSTPPDALRKSLRVEQCSNNIEPSTSGTSAEGMSLRHVQAQNDTDTCYGRLWQRVQKAELRRGGDNYDEDLFRILIDGIDSNHCTNDCLGAGGSEPISDECKASSLSVPRASKDGASSSTAGKSRNTQPAIDLRDSHPCAVTRSACCSSSDTVLSSPGHPGCDLSSSTSAAAAESTNRSTFFHAWSKYFGLDSTESLDDEPSFEDHQRLGFSNPELSSTSCHANSGQGDDREDPSSSSSSSGSTSDAKTQDYMPRAKIRRKKSPLKEEQYLIFTLGSQTYVPHQIGIKRIDATMANTLRGPLGVSKQSSEPQGEGREEQGGAGGPNQQGGLEFDSVDHVIELNGQAIGLALSPDHRYLYVNCRCWPRDCVVSDPMTPPPIAREIEIRAFDLVNMTEVKRFFGHKAFTPNELNFIFLDVCSNYVASGAENRHAFVWDRHYGILLARLPHRDVVNSVAFNPRDPEMMVTVSDDHTIKIWFSQHKAMMTKIVR